MEVVVPGPHLIIGNTGEASTAWVIPVVDCRACDGDAGTCGGPNPRTDAEHDAAGFADEIQRGVDADTVSQCRATVPWHRQVRFRGPVRRDQEVLDDRPPLAMPDERD
ncbi:MAG: hypothetical protein EBV53_15595 [Proteobacteria bacterium]|nr:hypothetical protein [Pseudomonadota bacterium]